MPSFERICVAPAAGALGLEVLVGGIGVVLGEGVGVAAGRGVSVTVKVGIGDRVAEGVAEGSTTTDVADGAGPQAASNRRLTQITKGIAKNGDFIVQSSFVSTTAGLTASGRP